MLKWYHPRSGSVSRRFESFYLDYVRKNINILESSNSAGHQPLKLRIFGSNPSSRTIPRSSSGRTNVSETLKRGSNPCLGTMC